MSGGDNIVINTRERAVSDDINDLQDVQYRTLMEMFRFGLAQNQVATSASGTDVRAVVLGGLTVGGVGGDVNIAVGILMQDSLTLPPVPGPLDSRYRIGRLGDPLAVPVAANEGWHLIEVNMVQETTLSTTRDIFDPATETFVPASVTKQTVQTLEATSTFGSLTDSPAPTGGDLIALAMVHKDGLGVIDQVIDLRPLQDDVPSDTATRGQPTYIRNRWVRPDAGPQNDTPTRTISWDHEVLGRRRMWMGPEVDGIPQFEAFDSAQWATPDAPGVGGARWVHFHMCDWFGYVPRQAYANYKHQGVLVVDQLDRGTTSQGSRITQAGIPLPAPFSAYTTQGNGDGVCIGGLPYNVVNGDVSPNERLSGGWMSDNGQVKGVDTRLCSFRFTTDPTGVGVAVRILDALFRNTGAENDPNNDTPFPVAPSGVRALDVRAESVAGASSDVGLQLRLEDAATAATFEKVSLDLCIGGYGLVAGGVASGQQGESYYEISLLTGTTPAQLEIRGLRSNGNTAWGTSDMLLLGYWF